MNVLVMKPGSHSLKVEAISCSPTRRFASDGTQLVSLILEGIGKTPCLSVMQGKKVTRTEPIQAKDYGEAAASLFSWLQKHDKITPNDIQCLGLGRVHAVR